MEGNKQIAMRVLKGAFIDRDPSVVDRYFSPTYIQHNPSIPNGPAPIPGLIASLSKDFSYEPGMAVAEGDLVMVHGRYVGWGPKPMIARRHLPTGGRKSRRALGRHAGGSAGVSHRERQPDVRASGRKVGPRDREPRIAGCSVAPALAGSVWAVKSERLRRHFIY